MKPVIIKTNTGYESIQGARELVTKILEAANDQRIKGGLILTSDAAVQLGDILFEVFQDSDLDFAVSLEAIIANTMDWTVRRHVEIMVKGVAYETLGALVDIIPNLNAAVEATIDEMLASNDLMTRIKGSTRPGIKSRIYKRHDIEYVLANSVLTPEHIKDYADAYAMTANFNL